MRDSSAAIFLSFFWGRFGSVSGGFASLFWGRLGAVSGGFASAQSVGVGGRAAAVASGSDSCRLGARGWSWDAAGSRGVWVLDFAFC